VRWEKFGTHEYRIEPPDVFHMRPIGALDVVAMRHMMDVVKALSAQIGRPVFWLADAAQFVDMTTDARKLIAGIHFRGIVTATGVYGGTFRQRTLANMVVRAAALLSPGPPVRVFLTEAEARGFLDAFRARA
jgi:hypothetical protein